MSTDEDDFKDQIAAIKSKADTRTPCRYGAKCWDTNAAHKAKFSHPSQLNVQEEKAPLFEGKSKRPVESDEQRPAAGALAKQASLLGWINVKRKPEGGAGEKGNGSTSQEKEKKSKSEQQPPRRPSRALSDLLLVAVEDSEKTTTFPSELDEVPQELEARMTAQQRFEGGGSKAWIDLGDKRPAPAMSLDPDLPVEYDDAWDDAHVRLPCSPRNTYRRKSNKDKDLSRWYLIQTALADGISSSTDLHEAILSYHPKVASSWDFSGMHSFFNNIITKDENALFFSNLLPRIIHLAFQLPRLCTRPIPLLVPGQDRTVLLSQMQIASLLANAFLCTFPRQGPRGENSGEVPEAAPYQNINMHTLWATPYGNQLPASQAAKVRCFLHYLDRVTRTGKVSFRRLQLKSGSGPEWATSKTPLSPITVHSAGLIEDECTALQIDFANKMIGGGVLGRGCIQEEIRFVINPELLVSLLFTAQMSDREAVTIVGAERFANYRGYGKTFEFSGPHVDKTPLDDTGRRQTEVIAVDALYYGASHRTRMAQWKDDSVERELNKFFCGVQVYEAKAVPPAVATGNWGCGNFGGYHDLKALVQWMAASEAGRPLIYFTFGEPGLAQQLRELAALLVQNSVSVGALRRIMKSVSENLYKEGGEGEGAVMPQLFNILFDRYEQ